MNKLVILFFLFITNVYGFIADSKKPINVIAKEVFVDQKNGFSTYTGDVVVKQGSVILKAATIRIYHPNKHPKNMVAIGSEKKPAYYYQVNKKKEIIAKALRMDYKIKNQFLKLEGNAKLRQGNDTFDGHILFYDIKLDKVKAKGKSKTKDGKKGRIKFTIQL